MTEILNPYKDCSPSLEINMDNFVDLVLSRDAAGGVMLKDGVLYDECMAALIDMSREECLKDGRLVSANEYMYESAETDEATVPDVGLTFTDNGLIRFNPNTITNEDFLKMLKESSMRISDGDKRLQFFPVDGSLGKHTYPYELNDGYVSLKGGFFQGFFRLDGYQYKVFPSVLDSEWGFSFLLRPMNYPTEERVLNAEYPDNAGFFFYIGTRAENKFAAFYGDNIDNFPKRENAVDEPCDGFDGNTYEAMPSGDDVENGGTCPCCGSCCDHVDEFIAHLLSESETGGNGMNEGKAEPCSSFFDDGLDGIGTKINDSSLTTADGKPLKESGYYEIETDNKYLLFDRGRDGYTIDTWPKDNPQFVLTGITKGYAGNLFIEANRGRSGKTTDNLKAETSVQKKYDVLKDVTENALGIRMRGDGAIGYRYIVADCDADDGYSVLEEYTVTGAMKSGRWSSVFVRLRRVSGRPDECGNGAREGKMRILIYVDGRLALVSKILPMIRLRRLDDLKEKQVGVPFCMSLGGGTQGLAEASMLSPARFMDRVLPLERSFAGSFIGDIAKFDAFVCPVEYAAIAHNAGIDLSGVRA